MSVYIEYVILDNLIINAIIIFLTSKLLKINFNRTNILLASVLGAAFAVVMPFINLNAVLFIIVKFLIGLAMVTLLKKWMHILELVITYVVFLFMTFAMGGVCFGLIYIFRGSTQNALSLIYIADTPIGIILLIVIASGYILLNLFNNFYKRRTITNFLYSVTFYYLKNSIRTNAFLDTGNMLSIDNKPVVLINYLIFSKLFDRVKVTDILLGNINNLPLKNAKYMYISGVANKKNKMLVFEIDQLLIEDQDETKIITNFMVGLSLNKFNNMVEYNALLNPQLF